MADPLLDVERLRLAEDFLQEAVYRSRQSRAAPLDADATPPTNCGLGEHAAVDLELTPRARDLFGRLWPAGLPPSVLERANAAIAEWIERADALDRKRNHFLKAFRQTHGFDRTLYSPPELAEFDSGLEAINAEVRRAHTAAAHALLGLP